MAEIWVVEAACHDKDDWELYSAWRNKATADYERDTHSVDFKKWRYRVARYVRVEPEGE